MSTTRFSVILATDDQSALLERAICSVLDQTAGDAQLIVVRHGTSDHDQPIIRFYRSDINTIIDAPGANLPEAFNHGIKAATGSHLLFLTGCAMLLPDTLSHIASTLDSDTRTPWIVGTSLQLNTDDRILSCIRAFAPDSITSFLRHDAGHLPIAGAVLSRDLFDRFGPFDARLDAGFDYEFACRLLVAGVEPSIDPTALIAQHELEQPTAEKVIRHGLAIIEAARRHARVLSLTDRLHVWRNCDLRQRIYALARAELQGEQARNLLWYELIRHPWWAFNERLRQVLLFGLPSPDPFSRRAA